MAVERLDEAAVGVHPALAAAVFVVVALVGGVDDDVGADDCAWAVGLATPEGALPPGLAAAAAAELAVVSIVMVFHDQIFILWRYSPSSSFTNPLWCFLFSAESD